LRIFSKTAQVWFLWLLFVGRNAKTNQPKPANIRIFARHQQSFQFFLQKLLCPFSLVNTVTIAKQHKGKSISAIVSTMKIPSATVVVSVAVVAIAATVAVVAQQQLPAFDPSK
jgi:hypothetical protein